MSLGLPPSLHAGELYRALCHLELEVTEEESDLLFASWDVSGDGAIGYTELLAALHSGRR
jgi:Ca2+-binding EF-hand superfamily protein